jgi:hypothetical protein
MRKLLRPGGRHAFTSIHTPPDLTPAEHRLAGVSGPPAAAGADPAELLERAGFTDIAAYDVTADYLATATAWRAARVRHRDELRPLDPEVYEDRLAHGALEVKALQAGLLRRTLYIARRNP